MSSLQEMENQVREITFYLYPVLLTITFDLICQVAMSGKIVFFTPKNPQVPPLGHDPGDRIEILFDMFYICFISFICENTHKGCIKIFEIDFVIEI